jgi:hypothetical protein
MEYAISLLQYQPLHLPQQNQGDWFVKAWITISGKDKTLFTVGVLVKLGRMTVLGFLASGLIFIGCAKMPEKLVTPTLKIETVVKDNREMYKMMLSTGIQNENSDVALLNVKGTIFFSDGESRLLTLPFTVPIVLPFDTGVIEIEKFYTENEIMPLVTLLGSDKEKLEKERGIERSFMEDKNIGFDLAGYEKKNILDILKDKLNEEN